MKKRASQIENILVVWYIQFIGQSLSSLWKLQQLKLILIQFEGTEWCGSCIYNCQKLESISLLTIISDSLLLVGGELLWCFLLKMSFSLMSGLKHLLDIFCQNHKHQLCRLFVCQLTIKSNGRSRHMEVDFNDMLREVFYVTNDAYCVLGT